MLNRINRLVNRWKYRLKTLNVKRVEIHPESLAPLGYSSQCGQDKLIVETILPGLKNGIFVDVGAHDGVKFSNTFFLEEKLGWTGLAIEPIPEVFAKLKNNRKCSLVNGCVAAHAGKSQFQIVTGYGEMLSGLRDEHNERHLKRINREMADFGGSTSIIEVECFTLNQLLEVHRIKHVDYLTIDAEGAEYSILSNFDFNSYSIQVIGLENNYKDCRMMDLLLKNGYRFHSILDCDEFYVKK